MPITVTGGTIEHSHDPFGMSDLGVGVQLINFNFVTNTASTVAESVTLDGVALLDNATGVAATDFSSFEPSATGTVAIGLTGGTSINGGPGAVGLIVDGTLSSIIGDTLNDTSFSNLPYAYLRLFEGAEFGHTVDATGATFDGFHPGTATVSPATLPTYYDIEDRISDHLDSGTVGYVKLKAGYDFLAHSSEVASAGSMQRVITAATANDTVEVQGGTFVANSVSNPGGIFIDKSLTLLGAQAGMDPRSGPRPGGETIILPGASNPNPNSATDVITVYVAASNVTINGFTIDGDNPGLTSAVNFNGANIDAAEGIASFEGVDHITITDNIVKNTTYTGIDFDNYVNSMPTANNSINHNYITNLGGGGFGYGLGVVLQDNFYAAVTDNKMDTVRVGVQTGNFYAANPGPAATISNNAIQTYRLGIFYNLHYSNASPFTVNNNVITAQVDPDNAAVRWAGIWISSQQTNVSATFSGNTINGTGTSLPSTGIYVWNTPTTGSMLVTGGGISNVDNGIWVTNYDAPSFGNGSNTHVTVTGVSISARNYGVRVDDSPSNSNGATVSATINGNTDISTTGGTRTAIFVSGSDASATISGNNASIHGNVIGVDVNGGSATITNNHIYDNGAGVRFTNGGHGSVAGNNFDGGVNPDNATDLQIAATASAVTIGAANSFAGDTDFIDNLSSQNYDLTGANAQTYEGVNPATLTDDFRIEDHMHHKVDTDNTSAGLITWVTNNVYVTDAGTDHSIQQGIAAASNGFTVNVETGTFVENVVVDKSVTILGQGAGLTIVEPSFVGANTGGGSLAAGSSNVFLVQANNVEIAGLTVDGDNPNLTSGIVVNGADIDARNGIITNHLIGVYNNLYVHDVTVQNIYLRGIYASSGGTFHFAHNTVDNVAADPASIAMFNSGGAGLIEYNTVSRTNDAISANHSRGTQFLHNVVTNSGSGIHTDNAGDGGGTPDLIQDNMISNMSAGAYGIFVFVPYNGVVVDDNQVSGVEVGLAALGGAGGSATFTNNMVDTSSRAGSVGEYVTTSIAPFGSASVNATLTNNTTKNASTLVQLEQENAPDVFTSNPAHANLTLNGNTLDNSAVTLAGTTGVAASGGTLTVGASNQVLGGVTGLSLNSSVTPVVVTGNTLNELSFSGQSGQYIALSGGALSGLTLIATSVSFDGVTGATATNAQNFAIEDKVFHKIDNASLGFVLWKASNVFVTPTATPSATNNDYTRLANAVAVLGSGWTMNLQGAFNWAESNAAASWAMGNDGISQGGGGDDYALSIPGGLNNVTITAPGGLGTATIQGPGDIPTVDLEGVFELFSGVNHNTTISNLQINDFDLSIGFFDSGSGTHEYDGTHIVNNHIIVAGDVATAGDTFQNIGIHFSFGQNQTIQGNVIDLRGDSVTVGTNSAANVGMQSNTSGGNACDGLLIDGNFVNVYGAQSANPGVVLGIWENAHGHASNITVSNNHFVNHDPGNDPILNLQRAFEPHDLRELHEQHGGRCEHRVPVDRRQQLHG